MQTGFEMDGYQIIKLESYFNERGYYVEDFTTSDGRQWLVTYPPETWSPEIRKMYQER